MFISAFVILIVATTAVRYLDRLVEGEGSGYGGVSLVAPTLVSQLRPISVPSTLSILYRPEFSHLFVKAVDLETSVVFSSPFIGGPVAITYQAQGLTSKAPFFAAVSGLPYLMRLQTRLDIKIGFQIIHYPTFPRQLIWVPPPSVLL